MTLCIQCPGCKCGGVLKWSRIRNKTLVRCIPEFPNSFLFNRPICISTTRVRRSLLSGATDKHVAAVGGRVERSCQMRQTIRSFCTRLQLLIESSHWKIFSNGKQRCAPPPPLTESRTDPELSRVYITCISGYAWFFVDDGKSFRLRPNHIIEMVRWLCPSCFSPRSEFLCCLLWHYLQCPNCKCGGWIKWSGIRNKREVLSLFLSLCIWRLKCQLFCLFCCLSP